MDQLRLPDDPHGGTEAHDVLAADEFAIPAGPDRSTINVRGGGRMNPLLVLMAAASAALLYRALKRR